MWEDEGKVMGRPEPSVQTPERAGILCLASGSCPFHRVHRGPGHSGTLRVTRRSSVARQRGSRVPTDGKKKNQVKQRESVGIRTLPKSKKFRSIKIVISTSDAPFPHR